MSVEAIFTVVYGLITSVNLEESHTTIDTGYIIEAVMTAGFRQYCYLTTENMPILTALAVAFCLITSVSFDRLDTTTGIVDARKIQFCPVGSACLYCLGFSASVSFQGVLCFFSNGTGKQCLRIHHSN